MSSEVALIMTCRKRLRRRFRVLVRTVPTMLLRSIIYIMVLGRECMRRRILRAVWRVTRVTALFRGNRVVDGSYRMALYVGLAVNLSRVVLS